MQDKQCVIEQDICEVCLWRKACDSVPLSELNLGLSWCNSIQITFLQVGLYAIYVKQKICLAVCGQEGHVWYLLAHPPDVTATYIIWEISLVLTGLKIEP